ncbi:hypothetical protein BSKO_01918 [Bryopsis sp. KO-2023]|nr:hypothetical protein BSKO_01918 [Bryopsis sp. KO-2023]
MEKSIASALKDAHKFEQQADRKTAQQAANLYEKAVNKYHDALNLGASGEQSLEARMGKGDCYQKWAEALLHKMVSLTNDDLTIEAERRAQKRAEALYQSAVDEYKQTDTGSCQMDFNASVNCGNTLASWAELCEPREACRHLQEAAMHYRTVLQLDSEDTEVWQNLSDVLVQLGESLCETDRQSEGEECFREAFESYTQSCGLCDSRKGDDLPGLLENWGLGLVTASRCIEDVYQREEYANDAIKRLKDAATFHRGRPDPFCGLGDAYTARSLLEPLERSLETLSLAVEEGYGEALKLDRSCAEAVLGNAEVHMMMGKRLRELGDEEGAVYRFTKCADVYGHALCSPQALGGFKERSTVQYNYGCACILAGRLRIAEAVFRRLIHKHGCTGKDLMSDSDFESVKHEPWFQQLLLDAGEMTD